MAHNCFQMCAISWFVWWYHSRSVLCVIGLWAVLLHSAPWAVWYLKHNGLFLPLSDCASALHNALLWFIYITASLQEAAGGGRYTPKLRKQNNCLSTGVCLCVLEMYAAVMLWLPSPNHSIFKNYLFSPDCFRVFCACACVKVNDSLE